MRQPFFLERLPLIRVVLGIAYLLVLFAAGVYFIVFVK